MSKSFESGNTSDLLVLFFQSWFLETPSKKKAILSKFSLISYDYAITMFATQCTTSRLVYVENSGVNCLYHAHSGWHGTEGQFLFWIPFGFAGEVHKPLGKSFNAWISVVVLTGYCA